MLRSLELGWSPVSLIQILHMSDIHNDVQARIRSAYLAEGGAECDVVALTGDCVDGRFDELPEAWDFWPQRSLRANNSETPTRC